MDVPFYYDWLNEYNGFKSTSGTVINDRTTFYFVRKLYQRVISRFHFNIPEEWDYQYFMNVLFKKGYIGIIYTDKYGVIPQICTLTGNGLYYQPTRMLVSQPLVQFNERIGNKCQLIKLTPDYMGIGDIVIYYALQLSQQSNAIRMAIENSKISKLIGAKNKSAKLTLETIAEKVSAGETTIVYDKELKNDSLNSDEPFWTEYFNDANYHVNEYLDVMDVIIRQFDNEIGINTPPSKKERLITNEIETMNESTQSRSDTWKECLNESIPKVNSIFNLNISYRIGGVDN